MRFVESVMVSLGLCAAVACSTSDEAAGGGNEGGATAGSGGSGTDAASSTQSGEFVLLCYNVAGLPDVLSGSDPQTNMPLIAPLLNDYDLVLVQESWLTPDPNPYADQNLRVYHEILVAASDQPYQSVPAEQPFGSDPSRPTALLADGLNRFSRFPFGPIDRQAWTDCFGDATTGASDCLAFKGFSKATHTLADGVEVDVYNLHAEAGSTDTDQALQVDDFEQLGDYVVANSDGKAIIVTGDTNLHTELEEDRAIWDAFLAKTGLTDVCAAVDCGTEADRIEKLAFRSDDGLTIEPTSREFARDQFVRDDGAALSDHPPLVVGVGWTYRE